MQLLKKPFLQERFPDACCVYLAVPGGATVILSSVGAAVRAVLCPRPDGSLKNIVLSFADDGALAGNGLYAGAVLAPAAGRISAINSKMKQRYFFISLKIIKQKSTFQRIHGGLMGDRLPEIKIARPRRVRRRATFRLIEGQSSMKPSQSSFSEPMPVPVESFTLIEIVYS